MTISATLARFHELLTDQSVGSRALTVPLERATDDKIAGTEVEEQIPTKYILKWISGPSHVDNMAEGTGSFSTSFELTLSHRMGRGPGSGEDVQDVQAFLGDLWRQVVRRLESINNLERLTTGCVWTHSFTPGRWVPVNGRMQMTGTFVAWIDETLGPL